MTTARTPVPSLFASLIGETDTLTDRLLEMKVDELKDTDANLVAELPLGPVLVFELNAIAKAAAESTDPELEDLRKALANGSETLAAAWDEFDVARRKPLATADDLEYVRASAELLRTELFRNLLILSPDTAVNVYYARVLALHQKLAGNLPTTDDNRDTAVAGASQLNRQLQGFSALMQQMLAQMQQMSPPTEEEAAQGFRKFLETRRRAGELLERAGGIGRDAATFLESKDYLKRDLLTRDLGTVIGKSQMAFAGKPADAKEALTAAIGWQEELKLQSRQAVAIETEEGDSKKLVSYLSRNQTDVMDAAATATEKIRELREQPAGGQPGGAQVPGMPGIPGASPGGGQGQGAPANTENLDKALAFVQDAVIEAGKIKQFLDAAEYHNTSGKHERVIELLKEALAALENDQDKKNDESGQDQKQQQDGQDQQQQQQASASNPLQLSPEQARALLNELNQDDKKETQQVDAVCPAVRTVRPW